MDEQQKAANKKFLQEALAEFQADVLRTLEDSPGAFFNGQLELTVQGGVIKTYKPGIQKCRHATASSR